MGIFNKSNQAVPMTAEQGNKILEEIKLLSEDWESIQTTNRKADILASNTAMNITAGTAKINTTLKTINTNLSNSDNSSYDSNTFNMIQNLSLPSYMTWDYYVLINQWSDYWVNRYSEFEHDKKENILTAIRIANQFGLGAITKKDFKPLFIQIKDNGDFIGYSAWTALNKTFASVENGNLKISKKAKAQVYKEDELYIFTWRSNNIGDFVWVMKYLLTDLMLKKIIECNATFLQNKVIYKCKNKQTIAPELKTLTNPYSNWALIFGDDQSDDAGTTNKIVEQSSLGNKEAHIPSLIEALKNHQEYYYNLFGRPITSSKQQSLSGDANLSISSSELVCKEHDRRVEAVFKQMGIELELPEIETEPENQNADKNGQGTANTNGDNVKEKA